MLYLYIAVGGVAGTLARYGIGAWIRNWAGAGFPWGTLAVNLVGSFLLGLAIETAEVRSLSPEFRGMVAVGFCGAFTTFSTFGYETIALLQEGAWSRAVAYVGGSVVVGLLCVALGISAGAGLAR